MYDFLRKSLVKMKKALCNCFKEIFYRLLFYGMNCNPHWNKNFEAASPQASDCTSQFVTWFHLVNILWKNHEPYWERPPGRRGEAASCFKYPYHGSVTNRTSYTCPPSHNSQLFSSSSYWQVQMIEVSEKLSFFKNWIFDIKSDFLSQRL